jgi:drug/metabolite transporter (DMT)-like permease
MQGLYVAILVGAPLSLITGLVSGQLIHVGDLPLDRIGALVAAGIIHFVIGRYTFYRSIKTIGATRTNPLLSLSGPYSLLMAVFVLGEDVSLLLGVAIVLMIIGPAIIVERNPSRAVTPPEAPAVASTPRSDTEGARASTAPSFEFKQKEGYSFGLITAFAWGTTPLLIRWGLADTGLGIAGATIAYMGAFALLVIALALSSAREAMGTMDNRLFKVFIGASLSAFIAQLLRFWALSIAPVTIVNSLQRVGIVFTLGLSYWFNRSLEIFSKRMLFGVAISLVGSVMLAVFR